MKGRNRRNKFGTLLFFIPIALVLAIVVYAVLDTTVFQNGTLVVRAQTSARYYPIEYLNTSVTVSGRSGITPYTLSLPPGTYTVNFPSEDWFTSPPSRSVTVTPGETSFVVGVYNPVPEIVAVNSGGFSVSKVTVLHRVTPLVWVNPSSDYQVISSNLTGRIFIPPLQNYTYVFQSKGAFGFSLVGSQSQGLVVTST